MTDMTDAAKAVNSFFEALAAEGFGGEILQKVTIAAVPVIVAVVSTAESED
jgi:hypothetical protein